MSTPGPVDDPQEGAGFKRVEVLLLDIGLDHGARLENYWKSSWTYLLGAEHLPLLDKFLDHQTKHLDGLATKVPYAETDEDGFAQGIPAALNYHRSSIRGLAG